MDQRTSAGCSKEETRHDDQSPREHLEEDVQLPLKEVASPS